MKSYFQTTLQGEDCGKPVIGVAEEQVPGRVLVDRVFGGEGDGAEDDDQHDEHVEQLLRHDPVNQNTNPVKIFFKL